MEFPKLEPENYRWSRSATNPRTIERRAVGTEAWVGIKDENYKGQYDLFLNTSMTIRQDMGAQCLSLSLLRESIVESLVELRFEHPESAGTARWDHEGPFLQYTPPESNEVAISYAYNATELWPTAASGFEVRKKIGVRRREHGSQFAGPSRPLSVHLIADVADASAPIAVGSRIEVLLHMNHMYWDGISARMFLGTLLRKTGAKLGTDKKLSQLAWGKEVGNLAQPILDASKIDISTLGHDFENARGEFIESLRAFAVRANYQRADLGAPATEVLSFTAAESLAIIQSVKSRLGPGFTISHLGQAATALALLKVKPVPDSESGSPDIIMPLPVNGRRYLKDEYVADQYGACQAGAVVQLLNARSFMVDDRDENAVISTLEKICHITKEQYDYWLSKPLQMAVNVSKDHFLASSLSSTPQEPSFEAVPIFISDGLNDRFVLHDMVQELSGKVVMNIDSVTFFTDSYLPGLLVRMESWKGATSLGLSYNEGSFAAEQALELLRHIMYYMLVFTG